MTILTPDMVHHQPAADIPDNLIIWQDENIGIPAYTQAARDLLNGTPVLFAVCEYAREYPKILHVTRFAMTKNGPRICGENGDPDGPGSHALIASHYDYTHDHASLAVALAQYLGLDKNLNAYRLHL